MRAGKQTALLLLFLLACSFFRDAGILPKKKMLSAVIVTINVCFFIPNLNSSVAELLAVDFCGLEFEKCPIVRNVNN